MKTNNSKKIVVLQIIIIAIVLSLVFISLIVFVKGSTFESYYKNKKIAAMKTVYSDINDAFNDGNIDSEEFDLAFISIVERNNINIIILDTATNTIKVSSNDSEHLTYNLLGYLFGKSSNPKDTVLEIGNNYEIHLVIDQKNEDEYLDLWGILDNGDPFLIRSPMEGIRESTRIASNFFSYFIGAFAVASIAGLILYGRHATISELRRKNAELEMNIRQNEENERMRTEFLSGVSHELKTPIAIIQGYAEGLVDCVNQDEESRNYYCEVIVDEASKMNDMVQKLLMINNMEFGDMIFNESRFDIVELIRNSLNTIKILIENSEAKIIMEDYEPIYVFADDYYVEEVLNNYLTNAIHHLDGERVIRIGIEIKENTVEVKVYNSGEPVPEESLPHLFEKFYKVDKARTREYGGSGVGLSIVAAIMKRMGQSYGVRNLGDGVEFYFTLCIDNNIA